MKTNSQSIVKAFKQLSIQEQGILLKDLLAERNCKSLILQQVKTELLQTNPTQAMPLFQIRKSIKRV